MQKQGEYNLRSPHSHPLLLRLLHLQPELSLLLFVCPLLYEPKGIEPYHWRGCYYLVTHADILIQFPHLISLLLG